MLTDAEKLTFESRRSRLEAQIFACEQSIAGLVLELKQACLNNGGHEWGESAGVFGRYCTHCGCQDGSTTYFRIALFDGAADPKAAVVNHVPSGEGWKP